MLARLDANNRITEDIKAVEMRCYRRLLHISYKDHITNEIVWKKIQTAIGPYEDILTTVKKGNYDGSHM